MVLTILFVVSMFLWGLSTIPHPTITAFGWASSLLAWISVLILGLFIFVPGLR